MLQIDKPMLVSIISEVAIIMNNNRDYLCELDAELGDGDLGLTMAKIFNAADKVAKESEETDLGRLLVRCGIKMNAAAPSTMGTLISSGYIYAGKMLSGKTYFTTKDFANMFGLIADGIATRGKAERGERTVLDSLYPAADAAKKALLRDADFATISLAALEGAVEGLEATKYMLPKHGKAAVFSSKALGKVDQGATAGKLMLEGFVSAIV